MKKIVGLLFLMLCNLLLCQENAFIINNKQVVWQRIYTSEKKAADIIKTLSQSGKITFDVKSDSLISGEIKDFIMDFKGAGYSLMGTPNYLIQSSKYHGNFKIQLKEGRYRASVTNITMQGPSLSLLYSGVGFTDNGNDNLETYALTNDRESFRNRFQGKESRIINYSFSQLFDISKYSIVDDDW